MRILHVIASLAPRYGGPSKACIDMAIAVAKRGHTVHVFTTDLDGSKMFDVPSHEPFNVHGLPVHYFRSTIRWVWPVSLALWRALSRDVSKYDLVHIHSLYLFHGAVAAHYCRKRGVPYIICPHGSLDPFLYKRHRFRKGFYETLVERRNLRGAAGIHFTAEEEYRLAEPYIAGAPALVVPLGLHLKEYASLPAPGAFRAAFPEVRNHRIVLYLGRLNFKKGLDILIEAFTQVATQLKDVHLVIAGPDNDGFGTQVRRWLAERGISNKATLTGMLQGDIKLAAFRDASVFALPSYSENFGIAVVEAMACGLPVVISDRVNTWREVETGGAGLVSICNAESFAAALMKALSNDKLARQMGEKGRALVAERFDWSLVGEKLETMYREVLSGQPKTLARTSSIAAIK